MADAFNRGDIVQLKSGGPPMTVTNTASDIKTARHYTGKYLCEWFKGASRDEGNFDEHVLKAYVAPVK